MNKRLHLEKNILKNSGVIFISIDDKESTQYSSCKKYKLLLDKNSEERLHVCGNIIAGINNLVFNTREDLYSYMRQFEGYTVPEAASAGLDNPVKRSAGHSISQNELPDYAKAAVDSLHHEKAADIKKKAGQKSRDNSEYNTLTLQI